MAVEYRCCETGFFIRIAIITLLVLFGCHGTPKDYKKRKIIIIILFTYGFDYFFFFFFAINNNKVNLFLLFFVLFSL
jgi:hypothetical protein